MRVRRRLLPAFRYDRTPGAGRAMPGTVSNGDAIAACYAAWVPSWQVDARTAREASS